MSMIGAVAMNESTDSTSDEGNSHNDCLSFHLRLKI